MTMIMWAPGAWLLVGVGIQLCLLLAFRLLRLNPGLQSKGEQCRPGCLGHGEVLSCVAGSSLGLGPVVLERSSGGGAGG